MSLALSLNAKVVIMMVKSTDADIFAVHLVAEYWSVSQKNTWTVHLFSGFYHTLTSLMNYYYLTRMSGTPGGSEAR
jgi:hypothetical protein